MITDENGRETGCMGGFHDFDDYGSLVLASGLKKEFTLTLKGFKTKEQVKAFIDWYEGQGEQDAQVCFEILQSEGALDVDFMPVDCSKPYVWNGNNLTANLKIK